MADIAQKIESLPPLEREHEIRRLIEEKKEQIASLEAMLPSRERRIIVNGTVRLVEKREISYEEVVEISHGPKALGRVLTVVCHGTDTHCTLIPGESVRVEDDMVFSAQDTSNG